MAISDAVQTLSAAFALYDPPYLQRSRLLTKPSGILLQAASGALFIYYRGHGSTIFQDGRRLALIVCSLRASAFLFLMILPSFETLLIRQLLTLPSAAVPVICSALGANGISQPPFDALHGRRLPGNIDRLDTLRSASEGGNGAVPFVVGWARN